MARASRKGLLSADVEWNDRGLELISGSCLPSAQDLVSNAPRKAKTKVSFEQYN
jgi:hypothetical protein